MKLRQMVILNLHGLIYNQVRTRAGNFVQGPVPRFQILVYRLAQVYFRLLLIKLEHIPQLGGRRITQDRPSILKEDWNWPWKDTVCLICVAGTLM